MRDHGGVPDRASTLKQLDVIRIVAIADLVLLVVLLIGTFTDNDSIVSIVGPIHGVGFLGLLFLTARGAGEGRWGWWFPIVTLVTTGPPGSLYGHLRVSRELDAAGR